MKTIGTILYGLIVLCAGVITVALMAVLMFGPPVVMAYDEGYPIDTAYPIQDPNQGPGDGHICDIAPWTQPEMCDEYLAEPEPIEPAYPAPVEPEPPEKEPAPPSVPVEPPVIPPFIKQPVIIEPITARLMNGFYLFVR